MFSELNMWDKATSLATESNGTTDSILKRKAQAQVDRKDNIEASKTYEQVGDYMRAIEILGEGGHLDEMMEIVRRMHTKKQSEMEKCVYFFRLHGNTQYAMETLTKMGDISGLMKILIELSLWDEAFKIAETDPKFQDLLFLPYGHWLAYNDRFQEAQEYYMKAGRADEAICLLKQLTLSSIRQECYEDASYYYYSLSKECPGETKKIFQLSVMYHAYAQIHKYIIEPFTFAQPETLLNASSYLLMKGGMKLPCGISQLYILYTLAKISKTLGYAKLCRWSFERLLDLNIPLEWQDRIELGNLLSLGSTGIEWSHPCVQCSQPVQFNQKFDGCIHCLNPTIRSIHTFEPLPLIQFEPTGVNNNEALELIEMESTGKFEFSTLEITIRDVYEPVKLNKESLLQLSKYQVFTKNVKDGIEFYVHVNKEVGVLQSQCCVNFFGVEEWNYQVLLEGKCPFCRAKVIMS
jgi:intraflagellar transport protein 122